MIDMNDMIDMIDKREGGVAMLNAQEAIMTRSTEAIGLPIALYTHRRTYVQANAECKEITALGDTLHAHNGCYH